MTKEEIQKENEDLKKTLSQCDDSILELNTVCKNLQKKNEELKKSIEAHKQDIEALENGQTLYKQNQHRLDVMISEKLTELENAITMNSVMRENLEALCRARNLLGGE